MDEYLEASSKAQEHYFPVTLLCRPWAMGPHFFQQCRKGVLNYVILRPATTALMFVALISNPATYEEGAPLPWLWAIKVAVWRSRAVVHSSSHLRRHICAGQPMAVAGGHKQLLAGANEGRSRRRARGGGARDVTGLRPWHAGPPPSVPLNPLVVLGAVLPVSVLPGTQGGALTHPSAAQDRRH